MSPFRRHQHDHDHGPSTARGKSYCLEIWSYHRATPRTVEMLMKTLFDGPVQSPCSRSRRLRRSQRPRDVRTPYGKQVEATLRQRYRDTTASSDAASLLLYMRRAKRSVVVLIVLAVDSALLRYT